MKNLTYILLLLTLSCSQPEELAIQPQLDNTVYYISVNGNDENDGHTPETAWATVNNINTNDFNGVTFYFEGGSTFEALTFLNYDEDIEITSYGNGRATIEGIEILNNLSNNTKISGFEIHDINISNAFVGINIQGFNDTSGVENIMLYNLDVYNCEDAGIKSVGYFATDKEGYSHSNIQVTNCNVYNISGYDANHHTGNGIVLSDVLGSSISNCTVYNCGYDNTHCGGNVGIWYWDAKDVIIQHCEAYNIENGTGCDGAGFGLDGGVVNGIMQYNYSHDNEGAGFQVGTFPYCRPMGDITIRYNISDSDANGYSGSLFFFGVDSTVNTYNVWVYNNTVLQDDSQWSVNHYGNQANLILFNNIMTSTYVIEGTLQAEAMNWIDEVELNDDYTLPYGSPLIDLGFPLYLIYDDIGTQDYFGGSNIVNGAQDIGAHEYNNSLGI